MSRQTESALVVFAREPRAGAVKMRLAAGLGAVEAARVYADLLSRTLQLAAASRFTRCYLFAADPSAIDYFEDRLAAGRWRIRGQCRGDIGQRMHDAMEVVLRECAFCALIGCDVADCTQADLTLTWELLAHRRASAVIGPSIDGGYWLIGLVEAHREVFDDIAWGTSRVLVATRARMTALGLEVVSLEPRHDIDEVEDLRFLGGPNTTAT